MSGPALPAASPVSAIGPRPIAIVTDFDGTITKADVGNELCIEAAPELFKRLHAELKSDKLTLKEYQRQMWSNFPMGEQRFRERARFHGALRPGVNEFFESCLDREIPVYIASCGLRPYIEEVLDEQLTAKAKRAVTAIRCNEARFGEGRIVEFVAPDNAIESPWPLDKGQWSQELKAHPGHGFVIGIGNGTSDRSLCGQVDLLLATDGLARFCEANAHAYRRFDDFFQVASLVDATGLVAKVKNR